MARTIAELVEVWDDAFKRGDIETLLELAHPEIEWDTGLLGTPTAPGAAPASACASMTSGGDAT